MVLYEFIVRSNESDFTICKFSRIEDVPSGNSDKIIILKDKKYKITDIEKTIKDSIAKNHATGDNTVIRVILQPL